MSPLSHSAAALISNLASPEASLARQQRLAVAAARKVADEATFNHALDLLRGVLKTADQAHTALHTIAQALQTNRAKPLDAVSEETILRLETFADELHDEVLA